MRVIVGIVIIAAVILIGGAAAFAISKAKEYVEDLM